jgi:hypothetical protein
VVNKCCGPAAGKPILEALVVPVLVEGVLAFPALAAVQTDPVLVEEPTDLAVAEESTDLALVEEPTDPALVEEGRALGVAAPVSLPGLRVEVAAMLLATYNPEGRRIFNRSEAERALEAAVRALAAVVGADASRAVAAVLVVAVDGDLTFDSSTTSF